MRLGLMKNRDHRRLASSMIPMFLAQLMALGCGEEIAPPTTPPIAKWCDLERPREDCLAESIYINAGNLEMAKALCSTPCTKIKSLSFGGADSEMLKAVKGFTQIDGLNILTLNRPGFIGDWF